MEDDKSKFNINITTDWHQFLLVISAIISNDPLKNTILREQQLRNDQ